MNLDQREQAGVVVLSLTGKVIGGPAASLLNDKVHELVESEQTSIVIDMQQVNLLNSSGLGILINALTTIRNANGDIRLAGTSEKIHHILAITKLTTVFKIYPEVDQAISSFSA